MGRRILVTSWVVHELAGAERKKHQERRVNMIVVPELEKIAELNRLIEELVEAVGTQADIDDLDLGAAYFVSDCEERDGHLFDGYGRRLDTHGLVDDLYYCKQYGGHCEDDFYGTLYFATGVSSLFVAVPFAT
jgi:hypothetical protein